MPPVPCPLPVSPAQLATCQMIAAQFADHRYLGFAALSVPPVVGLVAVVKAISRRPKGKRLHLSLPLPWGRHAATRRLKRDLTKANPRAWKDSDLQVLKRTKHAAGEELHVELPGGVHAGVFEGEGKDSGTEFLASAFGAQRVHVERHPDNARWAMINIMSRNPLTEAIVTPLATATSWNWHDGIPVGTSVKGHEVNLNLAWRNVLLSGAPDAGKSVAQSSIVAAAALDPRIKLYLFDANRVNLAPWKMSAEIFVGADHGHAIGVLERLVVEIDRRSQILEDTGLRKLPMDGDLREILIDVDELAFFIADAAAKKDSAYTTALLADIVRRGRFVGIEVVAATQRPSSQIVSTDLRDLFVWRWAMYCATQAAYIMALGEDWAKRGAEIRMGNPGEGLLLHESGTLEHLRAYNMPDDVLHAIAARAAALRSQATKPLAAEQSTSITLGSAKHLSVGGGSELPTHPQPEPTPVIPFPGPRGNHTTPPPETAPETVQPRITWTEKQLRVLQRCSEGPTRRKILKAKFFSDTTSKSSCTEFLDRLVSREVLTKTLVPGDLGRGEEVEYTLTNAGRAVLAAREGATDGDQGCSQRDGGDLYSEPSLGTSSKTDRSIPRGLRAGQALRDARKQRGGDVA